MEEIKKLVLPLLVEKEVELVELVIGRQRGRSVLRFLVDSPAGGITLAECAQLNREIGRLLDQNDIIQESYVLEVSSPGLDRPLVNTRDFQRCHGQLIKIVLHRPIDGQNVWIGSVDTVDDKDLVILTKERRRLLIARENIASAKQEVQL